MNAISLGIHQRFKLLPAFAFVSLAMAGTILFFFDPAHYDFYPSCFIRSITGLNCPGCGSLRAIHELLHGHVAAAVQLNLLLVLSLPLALSLMIRKAVAWRSGRAPTLEIKRVWLWTFLALALAFTVVRNLPGFEWLRA